MEQHDWYRILEVHPEASEYMIKKNYQVLLREAHPDKGGDAQRMALLNRAHEVLTNPTLRAQFDASQKQRAAPIHEEPPEAEEVFDDWGTEEVWSPPTPQPPPGTPSRQFSEPPHPPRVHPSPVPQPWPQGYPPSQQFPRNPPHPASFHHGASQPAQRLHVLSGSMLATASAVVWLLLTLTIPVLTAITDFSVVNVGISALPGVISYFLAKGRVLSGAWKLYVAWIALALLLFQFGASDHWIMQVIVGTWIATYVVATETRRRSYLRGEPV